MNTRKMCRHYYGSTVEERECRTCSNNTPCPDNVNAKCEIVPRKAKPKYKRVKAWAKRGYIAGPGEIMAQSFDCPTRLVRVPCIITMTEKDYNRVWPKKVLEAEAKWLKGRKA